MNAKEINISHCTTEEEIVLCAQGNFLAIFSTVSLSFLKSFFPPEKWDKIDTKSLEEEREKEMLNKGNVEEIVKIILALPYSTQCGAKTCSMLRKSGI